MRVSYRWLNQYLKFEKPVTEAIEALTMMGMEVEEYKDLGAISGKIMVGQIKKIKPHPNAANLVVCEVDTGEQSLAEIVCGAKNMKAGDKVVVALPEAELPIGTTIKKRRIRGVESAGMLCSGAELLWNEDQSGILILPQDLPVGEPFDCLLEIKVTPNRPDCLSILGLARDLGAKLNKKVYPPSPRFRESIDMVDSSAKVTVEAKDGCPRYTARVIRGVKIGASPDWLVRRLESAGLRSVNNVVDATNYVLLELGHPLHAFDLDKIADHHVIVRFARRGEKIETLDGETYQLSASDLLITDANKPVALAGIMGCANTEISENTANVLLECAYFNPVTIRRTSKRLDKQTESSYRFERGMDRENLTVALNRATELINDLAGGQVTKGIIDVHKTYVKPDPITLKIAKVNLILGKDFKGREIADELAKLGFELVRSEPEHLVFSVPSYRVDIKRDVDLIEEIARLHGYEKIPATLPYIASQPLEPDKDSVVEERISNWLIGAGISEVINYSFISKRQVEMLGLETSNLVELLNPLSQEQAVMRPSLVPGLLENFRFNHSRGVFNLRIFEIGKIFQQGKRKTEVQEEASLVIGLSGDRFEAWNLPVGQCDFFDIKGVMEAILNNLRLPDFQLFSEEDKKYYHPHRSARVVIKGEPLCSLGEICPSLSEQLELRRRVYLAEFNLPKLNSLVRLEARHQEIARFPTAERDLAIVVDEAITASQAAKVIRDAAGVLLEEVKLFDLYRGKQVPAGKKSLAYRLIYRAKDRTLKEEEITELQERIVKQLNEQLGAVVR